MPIEPSLVASSGTPKLLKFLLVVIAILLVGVFVVAYYLLKPAIQTVAPISDTTTLQTSQGELTLKSSFESCNVKEGNPLLSNFEKSDTKVSGTIKAKVQSIVALTENQSIINITTAEGDLAQGITVGSVEVTRGKEKSTLSQIKGGEMVFIYFTCDPKTQGNLQVSKVTVITPGFI